MLSIIITQVVFVIFILVLFLFARGNLIGFVDRQVEYQERINNTIDLIFNIQKFLRGGMNFKELEKLERDSSVEQEVINKIWASLYKFNNLNIENEKIQQEILDLTSKSIEKSNGYIFSISQRLADVNMRKNVSVIERLVIGGALTNTNASYKIREGIYKLEKDLSYKESFIPFLETLIVNAQEDIRNLKGTVFERLPVEALKSNKRIEQLSLSFIDNIRQKDILENTINTDLDNFLSDINNETFNYTQLIFDKLKTISTLLIFSTLSISILIIILLSINLVKIYKQIGTDPESIEQIADEIAQGNLKNHIENKDAKGVYRSIIEMNNKIVKIIKELLYSSGNIALSTNEMKANVQQVSQGASEQAASTEEVSATMEEITANIERSKNMALTTESTVKKTAEGILKSNKTMNENIEAMQKIAEKVKIINDIAFQTNILAINASIEASNAGEAGKGFSVVAREVGVLAENSKQAAIEIEALSESSVQKAQAAGEILEQMLPEIERTVSLITEVVGASVEQFSGAKQINSSIQQLNDITQVNAAASEEISASIIELAQQTENLKKIALYFKIV
jgi:methyl-accepting chemotaxis protein